jgi:hypothetical protein
MADNIETTSSDPDSCSDASPSCERSKEQSSEENDSGIAAEISDVLDSANEVTKQCAEEGDMNPISYNWVDITNEFVQKCSHLKLGELLHDPG